MRLKSNDEQKRLHEENEVLRLKNAQIGTKLRSFMKQSEVENAAAKELAEKKSEEYVNMYRNQVREKEENLLIIKVKIF